MEHQRKTICIITFSQGGPFVWAKNLARQLEKRGYAVKLSTGRKNYFLEQFRRYDILHTAVALPFSFSRKYILTIHGNYKEEPSLKAKIIYPLAIMTAGKVTTPSDFLRQKLGFENARVISNGIDLPEKKKSSYAFNDPIPTVGLLTNFNFRPKADGTLKLAEIISRISPEIRFLIGGDGEFIEEYKKSVLAIHPHTEFLGHCQKEDLFDRIDIFAYYSLLDNQPLALLEAMAYGLPVISNPIGAVPEIMTGKLSEYITEDDDDYQTILERLIGSEDERRNNGQEGIRKSQHFSWDKVVERFIELYK